MINRIIDTTDRGMQNNFESSIKDKGLYAKVLNLSDYFTDMYLLTDDTCLIPDELSYFNYDWFSYHIMDSKDMGENVAGYFDKESQTLFIAENNADDTFCILHELIHLHEYVLSKYPTFNDIVLWNLYIKIKGKVGELDKLITNYANIFEQNLISKIGGEHSILFLLKSLDLDIRQGYSLGTVFGYGKTDDLKDYSYT